MLKKVDYTFYEIINMWLSKYIDDKTQINQELEKLRNDQEETLHLFLVIQ
jgi:hypothetical protein